MNKEQAKAWLPLIQAVADGKTIQSGCFDYFGGVIVKQTWTDSNLPLQLEGIDPKYFRIKPEPKKQWCRMYLVKGAIANSDKFFFSAVAMNGHIRELEDVEKSPIFVCWITDRIEYELPEEEA